MKTEDKPITDLKNHIHPIKKRDNIVVGLVIFLSVFYLFILIFSILGQYY
jgi:hypothetical protein